MKRFFLLLLVLACNCSWKMFSQIIPGQRSGVLGIEKQEELEKSIEITEELLKDTTFYSITQNIHGVSDEQWKRVKEKMDFLYIGDTEDSSYAQLLFNRCLLEKYYLMNCRRYDRIVFAKDEGEGFSTKYNRMDEVQLLDGGEKNLGLMNCTWKQVWDALSEDELMIEFITNEGKEIALLIDKRHHNPFIVQLQLTEQNNDYLFEDELDDENLAIDFWGNCLGYMEGKKRIFFSPSISLSNLALEYFQLNGKTMYETYPLFRISSSREICKNRQKMRIKKSMSLAILDMMLALK